MSSAAAREGRDGAFSAIDAQISLFGGRGSGLGGRGLGGRG
ncbi:UNVERIFIED_ORG: hypothetical protein QOE_2894, partial [Clostridioides difficile F501]